jgi:hypothetical protein
LLPPLDELEERRLLDDVDRVERDRDVPDPGSTSARRSRRTRDRPSCRSTDLVVAVFQLNLLQPSAA